VHALEFWDLVVDAADSLVFRLMFNSLRAAYEPALEALAPLMAEEVGQVHAYRVLTAAIGAGDPETARAAADRVLRPATESLLAALAALDDQDEE
jgi:DNA-binding FadR family transcriptional regulator